MTKQLNQIRQLEQEVKQLRVYRLAFFVLLTVIFLSSVAGN